MVPRTLVLFETANLKITALSFYVTDTGKDQNPLNCYNRTGPKYILISLCKDLHYLFSVLHEKPISESSQLIRFSSGFFGLYDSVVK